MTAEVWMAGAIGIAATIDDLARRRISNWIPGCAFAGGLVLQVAEGGWRGAISALFGTAVGAGVFLIFYLLGGMGGGDVKLMAGFGAILGVSRLLEASLWTAGCGGLLALVVIATGGVRRFWRSRRGCAGEPAAAPGLDLPERGPRESIPYAPAITAGVWLSLVPKT